MTASPVPVPQWAPEAPTEHYYTGHGYGVEPCPVCSRKLLPGQERIVTAQEWRPKHRSCVMCSLCSEHHRTGECLL